MTIYRTLNRFAPGNKKRGPARSHGAIHPHDLLPISPRKAVRNRFNHYDKTKAEAEKADRAIAVGQMSRRQLTDDEVADYVSTRTLLVGFGKSLLPIAG